MSNRPVQGSSAIDQKMTLAFQLRQEYQEGLDSAQKTDRYYEK